MVQMLINHIEFMDTYTIFFQVEILIITVIPWNHQTVNRTAGEMLCLKLLPQFSSHVNETRSL